MLMRVFVICACVTALLCACKPSMQSKLEGTWRAKSPDDAGQIQFRSDHTFTSSEWAVTYSHQPPVLSDQDFRGDTRPADARHVEFTLAMPDNDHFTIRQANALETTLERLK